VGGKGRVGEADTRIKLDGRADARRVLGVEEGRIGRTSLVWLAGRLQRLVGCGGSREKGEVELGRPGCGTENVFARADASGLFVRPSEVYFIKNLDALIADILIKMQKKVRGPPRRQRRAGCFRGRKVPRTKGAKYPSSKNRRPVPSPAASA
jgi:hypothetical protein